MSCSLWCVCSWSKEFRGCTKQLSAAYLIRIPVFCIDVLESRVYITWFLQDHLNLSKMTLVKRVFSEDLAYSFSGHNIFCGRWKYCDEKCAGWEISCCHDWSGKLFYWLNVKDNCYCTDVVCFSIIIIIIKNLATYHCPGTEASSFV